MGIKEANEITVRVKVSIEEVQKLLIEKGFIEQYRFSLEDVYFVPKDLSLENLSVREILAHAVLARYIVVEGRDIPEQRLTFKVKEIAENGEILSQRATNCDVENIEDAKKFLEVIGYKELMQIKEYDVAYEKDGFGLETKDIVGGDNLIECETTASGKYTTIEALKQKIAEEDIPIYTDDFFVKKAEIELGKAINN